MDESKLLLNVLKTLKKANELKCESCNKKCDEYGIGINIDLKDMVLIGRMCHKCSYDYRYGQLTRKDFEFVTNLESVQSYAERLKRYISMKPEERLRKMKRSLKLVNGTLKDLREEAYKKNLQLYIR